jgi:hypothetical protein
MITLNLQMSYRCRIHPDVELDAFQSVNGLCTVGACIKCQQEQDMLHNNQLAIIQTLREKFDLLTAKNHELKLRINKLNEVDKTIEKKPSLYLNGRKINFVTKKKGGKK